MAQTVKRVYKGFRGQVTVDPDTNELTIGTGSNASRLQFGRITAIDFRDATRLSNGHLNIGVDGEQPSSRLSPNAHVVFFTRSAQPEFEVLRSWLEQLAQCNQDAANQAPVSAARVASAPVETDLVPETSHAPALISCAACSREISDKAAACPTCGHPTPDHEPMHALPQPISAASGDLGQSLKAEVPAGACPSCQQNDQVKRIATVIGVGSSSTTGTATTVGVGTFGIGAAGSSFNARTTSDLAASFATPKPPSPARDAGIAAFATFFGGLILVAMVLGNRTDGAMGVGAGLIWVAVALVAMCVYSQSARGRERRLTLWQAAHARLRDGYYCFRDNIAFESGGVHAADPDGFARRTFSEFARAESDRFKNN